MDEIGQLLPVRSTPILMVLISKYLQVNFDELSQNNLDLIMVLHGIEYSYLNDSIVYVLNWARKITK